MRKSITFGALDGKKLEWLVIDDDGDALTLWCRSAVAKMSYAKSYSPFYDESGVRDFLENELYEKAFSPDERAKILQTELDLSENQTYYGAFNGGATAYRREPITARIYLLSAREIIKTYAIEAEEIYRAEAQMLWTRSPFSEQTVSLVNCKREILDGKSPYTYISESYNPISDTYNSTTVPYSAYPTAEHSVVPALRIKKDLI